MGLSKRNPLVMTILMAILTFNVTLSMLFLSRRASADGIVYECCCCDGVDCWVATCDSNGNFVSCTGDPRLCPVYYPPDAQGNAHTCIKTYFPTP